MNALPILAAAYDEQFADADARTTRPALAALAALTLVPTAGFCREQRADLDAPAFVNGEATPAAQKVFADLAAKIAPYVESAADPQATFDKVMSVWQGILDEHAAASPERGPLTAAQRTLTLDEGLAAHRTTPIETELRDIDVKAEHDDLPWLAAEIVVSDDKPQAYGRTTEVWLHNGPVVGELTPAQGREALAAMREFADRYEALLDLADEIATGDFEGDPEIARLDREAEDARIKARTAELLAAEADR